MSGRPTVGNDNSDRRAATFARVGAQQNNYHCEVGLYRLDSWKLLDTISCFNAPSTFKIKSRSDVVI